jgi:hypothetical protein
MKAVHDSLPTVLTVLAVVAAALLNRADSKRTDTRVDALGARLDNRMGNLSGDIISMRERLARIEERIGIKSAAS